MLNIPATVYQRGSSRIRPASTPSSLCGCYVDISGTVRTFRPSKMMVLGRSRTCASERYGQEGKRPLRRVWSRSGRMVGACWVVSLSIEDQ